MAVSCRDATGDSRSTVASAVRDSRTARVGRAAEICGPYAAGPLPAVTSPSVTTRGPSHNGAQSKQPRSHEHHHPGFGKHRGGTRGSERAGDMTDRLRDRNGDLVRRG